MPATAKYTSAKSRRAASAYTKKSSESGFLTGCACGGCGALECLCRPRFFAGQLLTEEDLNRLDRYVRGKNRLHNLYLSGWGTVCGLEVLCHKCQGLVLVTAGYAIDPCGNDVIVCKDEKVDVCKLIGACRETRDPCDPTKPAKTTQSDDEQTESWLLYAEYAERATRGVTALRGASQPPCCDSCYEGKPCECGCNTDCGCGCRCSEKSNGHSHGNGKPKLKPQPAQCEPTVICESYRFGVCRMPEMPGDDDDSLGPLLDRMIECLTEALTALISGYEAVTSGDPAKAVQIWKRFLDEHPGTLCEYRIPTDSDNEVFNYFVAVFTYLLDCFCRAWIPPCPEVACDGRVPLAEITVTVGKCRVIRICNLTRLRRFVRTPPNIAYWLSPFQIVATIRELLESICCEGFDYFQFDDRSLRTASGAVAAAPGAGGPAAPGGAAGDNPDDATAPVARLKTPRSAAAKKRRFEDVLNIMLQPGSGLDLPDVFYSLTGKRDDKGQPRGTIREIGSVPIAMMLRAVALPLWEQVASDRVSQLPTALRSIVGSGMLGRTKNGGNATKEPSSVGTKPGAAEVDAMRAQVAEMQRQLSALIERMNR